MPFRTRQPFVAAGRRAVAILDWFVPERLRREGEASISLARTVAGVGLSAVFWGGALVVRDVQAGDSLPLALALILTLGLVAAPWLMRATGSLAVARLVVMGVVYVAVTGSALRYGGWLSPVFIVLAFLPAVAVAMQGPRLAVALLGVSTAIASWTFAADQLGWRDFGPPRAETHFFLAALVWFVLAWFWFLVIWAFRRHNELAVGELEASNAELIVARDQASAASHAKSAFLANMSHEIRTPLNGVLGLTELLAQTPLDARQRQLAENIKVSAGSLLDVINQVLDYSKVASAEIELECIPFELERPLEDVLRCLAVTAAEKGLELTAFLHPALPAVLRGDPFRLRQVLMNVVGNAIKFTEEGEVMVRVLPDTETAAPRRCNVLIEVEDTGIGFDTAARTKLFSPFAQADESTTRRFGGTGLGLAISQQLANRMGGGIEVESTPGRGSLFRIRAALEPAEDRARVTPRSPGAGAGRPRVLLIQPHPAQRRALSEYLRALDLPFAALAGLDEAPQWNDGRDGAPDVVIAEARLDSRRLHEYLAHWGGRPRLVLLKRIAESASAEGQPRATDELESPVLPSSLLRCLWPLRAESTPQAQAADDPAGAARFSARVLVAEDNPVNQLVARGMLEAAGCDVVVVADGLGAVEAARKEAFDLIVLDLQMPVMDGIEATERIRASQGADRPQAATPIVALSADLTAATRARAERAGIDSFVAKPFSRSDLAAVLAHFVEPAGSVSGDRS